MATSQLPVEGQETATEFPNSCTCKDLLSNAACLRDPTMSPAMRKAIQINLLNSIIAGINSTTAYTTDELVGYGKCCQCEQFQSLELDAMWTYILWALAIRVGATSDTAAELVSDACALNCDPRNMDGIYMSLLCQFMQAVDTLANA